MANMKIYGDIESGSIFFVGSTVDPKPLGGVIEASAHPTLTDRIIVKRNDRFKRDGVSFRVLFGKLNMNRVCNKQGEELVTQLGYTRDQVVDYINEQANLTDGASAGGDGSGTDLIGQDICFKLDDTSTSVMIDTGHEFGVNTIKAVANNGNIDIKSYLGDLTHFTNLEVGRVCGNDGNIVAGGLNDVINYLNELFTVGPFEAVVITDPEATTIANVGGVDAGGYVTGANALDPIGDDVYVNNGNNSLAGLLSTETISQAGEYFTFDIREEGQIGFGLVHTQQSFDDGKWSGSSYYADPSKFATQNSAHFGFQFSHWFHQTPNGSWTNYGGNTSYITGPAWSNWDKKQDWIDGNPVKIKVGIDVNGFIGIYSINNDGVTWKLHARTSYALPEGGEYRLGIKSANSTPRVATAPKVHLLPESAPTMTFRYIESPDGVFNYPLFATAEEAEYYDEIVNGASTGASHTHTYADDPTNTTWYMPEATHNASSYQHSSAPDGTETFDGNVITYTEVTSLTNADLTPTQFSANNITQEEGTNVNLQVTPQGASWSTSVSITPSGSGLVYDGYSLVQGTLADVGSDTVYTVTVTRANSYGSSVGSMTVTATDVAPTQTKDTSWTKALDFSGSSERAQQVGVSTNWMPVSMDGMSATNTSLAQSGYTSNGSYSRPWATAVVFKHDGNNSNQHIWNQGEGAGSSDDNIYLRVDSNSNLYFGWGRSGATNEVRIMTSICTRFWYGVYIAHDGRRWASAGATAGNLYQTFDIKVMTGHDNFGTLYTEGEYTDWNASTATTGARMDRTVTGNFTIGGRGGNRNFNGKIASMVCTTLRVNQPMPLDAEIEMMITDPMKWMQDYKINQPHRYGSGTAEANFITGGGYSSQATQIWLMGDGIQDSYSNGIRNQVWSGDQNVSKLNLISMVSNDIENVNIGGLT